MRLPNLFPPDADAKKIVDFTVWFLSVEGFMEMFEDNLKLYEGKVGVAYEATEIQYTQLFGHRRFADREVFYNALSRWRKKRREQ